jgi:AcrR family transcriptional regulator
MSKGERTRQRIVAASAPVFNQRGFAGASVQTILDATGLEKGGLYRHFASKDDLAVAAFKHSLKIVTDARAAEASDIRGAIPRLLDVVHQFVTVPSPVPGGCPIMNTAIDADDTHPALRALANEAIQAWKSRVVRIVAAGVRTGEIRPGTSPRRIANLIVATLEGSIMISRLEGNRNAMRDAEVSLSAVLSALAVPPLPEPALHTPPPVLD